jgi:hypothetical protein
MPRPRARRRVLASAAARFLCASRAGLLATWAISGPNASPGHCGYAMCGSGLRDPSPSHSRERSEQRATSEERCDLLGFGQSNGERVGAARCDRRSASGAAVHRGRRRRLAGVVAAPADHGASPCLNRAGMLFACRDRCGRAGAAVDGRRRRGLTVEVVAPADDCAGPGLDRTGVAGEVRCDRGSGSRTAIDRRGWGRLADGVVAPAHDGAGVRLAGAAVAPPAAIADAVPALPSTEAGGVACPWERSPQQISAPVPL